MMNSNKPHSRQRTQCKLCFISLLITQRMQEGNLSASDQNMRQDFKNISETAAALSLGLQEDELQRCCQCIACLFPQLGPWKGTYSIRTPKSPAELLSAPLAQKDGFSALETLGKAGTTFRIFLIRFWQMSISKKIIRFQYLKCLSLSLFSAQKLYPERNVLLRVTAAQIQVLSFLPFF